MRTVFETIAAAFSMFSALPVPCVEWNERNTRWLLAVFPLVGIVTGGLCRGWVVLCGWGSAARSESAALLVGTTAWWSVTFLLLHTWEASTVPGASTPQITAAADTSMGTAFSISSVRYRLSVRG